MFLNQSGRRDEAMQVLRELATSDAEPTERAWALSGLGAVYNDLGRCAEAMPLLERARRLDPNLPNALNNLGIAHFCLGRGQEAFDLREQAVELVRLGRASGQDRAKERRAWRPTELWLAQVLGDYRRQLRLIEQQELDGENVLARRAFVLAVMRDVTGSMRLLSQHRPAAPTDAQRRSYWLARYQQAAALDLWPAAATYRARAQAACARQGARCVVPARTQGQPYEAAALARAGDAAAAQAMVREMPRDCYNCAWARAIVAEAGGDRASADRWFGEAVRLGPRLSIAYVEWANAKLDRNDAAGALVLFNQALSFGPEQPDAHKGRADALARLGRRREALLGYRAAADRAPRWGALHLEWGIALWHAGRHDQARQKFRTAAGLDLSRRDRLRLRRILAAADRRT